MELLGFVLGLEQFVKVVEGGDGGQEEQQAEGTGRSLCDCGFHLVDAIRHLVNGLGGGLEFGCGLRSGLQGLVQFHL